MGLDSYLFKRGKTKKGKMLLALSSTSTDRNGNRELKYWRKNSFIHETFSSYRGDEQDDNVTNIIITKENLQDILDNINFKSQSCFPNAIELELKKLLEKLLLETDFDNEEIFYYAWY